MVFLSSSSDSSNFSSNRGSNSATLSESDFFNKVTSWPDKNDSWPFYYGSISLASLTSITSAFINRFYRRKLNLGNTVLISTSLASVVLPTFVALGSHFVFVMHDAVLKKNKCPICLQTKAAVIQVAATVYPVIVSSLVNFQFADRMETIALPSLTKQPKELLKYWMKLSKPLVGPVASLSLLQAMLVIFITQKEIEKTGIIAQKILESQES